MEGVDGWDLVIVGGAAWIAVLTLVRLMRARRDQLVGEVQQQLDARRQQRRRKKSQQDAA